MLKYKRNVFHHLATATAYRIAGNEAMAGICLSFAAKNMIAFYLFVKDGENA
jgi:hypothetical protein